MTKDELYSNAAFLTLAGSETTSTTTTVALYYMGMYPKVKARVVQEVLSAFRSEEEINMRSANTLPYLMGVIEESMRYHPPGPNALWRITPPEGNRILGEWVPGNVSQDLRRPRATRFWLTLRFCRRTDSAGHPTQDCISQRAQFHSPR
jgi:hypothetical protein